MPNAASHGGHASLRCVWHNGTTLRILLSARTPAGRGTRAQLGDIIHLKPNVVASATDPLSFVTHRTAQLQAPHKGTVTRPQLTGPTPVPSCEQSITLAATGTEGGGAYGLSFYWNATSGASLPLLEHIRSTTTNTTTHLTVPVALLAGSSATVTLTATLDGLLNYAPSEQATSPFMHTVARPRRPAAGPWRRCNGHVTAT